MGESLSDCFKTSFWVTCWVTVSFGSIFVAVKIIYWAINYYQSFWVLAGSPVIVVTCILYSSNLLDK